MAKGQEDRLAKIEVGRAIPGDYPAILNNLPKEWFAPSPHFMHLQIADMLNSNRFLIAYIDDFLVGTLGWQDNVAFGAYYVKFVFVKEEYRKHGVAFRLIKEVVNIAQEADMRAVYADVPADSPLVRTVIQVPGTREVGKIENFHGDGLTSVIVSFDMGDTDKFYSYADRVIAGSTKLGGATAVAKDYVTGE